MNTKEVLVNTLMVEYLNIHERVFYSIKKFEGSNVKVLTVMGIVLYYCFQNMETTVRAIALSVDLAFFFVMPILSLTALAMANSHMHEVIYFGNYLKIIENKVNVILSDEVAPFHFERNRLIDWEYWRRFRGYQREGKVIVNITFGIFSTTLVLMLYIVAVGVRLFSYYSTNYEAFRLWLSISVGIFLLMVLYICVSAIRISERRKKQAKYYKRKSTDYESMDV